MMMEKFQVLDFQLALRIYTPGLFTKNKVLDNIAAGINMHLTNETYAVTLDDLIVLICF